MGDRDFQVRDHERSKDERLTKALAEAIRSVIEQLGSSTQPVVLLVTVHGDRVSVSAASTPDDRLESFASWLRARVKEQRLTKVALADRLKVSERTVRRWLAGDTEPRFQELSRISSLLGNPPM